MGNASILGMKRPDVQFILKNHELFSPEDVRIAARREIEYRNGKTDSAESYNPYLSDLGRLRDMSAFGGVGPRFSSSRLSTLAPWPAVTIAQPHG